MEAVYVYVHRSMSVTCNVLCNTLWIIHPIKGVGVFSQKEIDSNLCFKVLYSLLWETTSYLEFGPGIFYACTLTSLVVPSSCSAGIWLLNRWQRRNLNRLFGNQGIQLSTGSLRTEESSSQQVNWQPKNSDWNRPQQV